MLHLNDVDLNFLNDQIKYNTDIKFYNLSTFSTLAETFQN